MTSRRLVLALAAASSFAGIVRAQDAPTADDANLGVFVRDSAVAADKLALADRMEKAHEWDTSADLYQEVLDGFADRVVPTHFDAQGRADRYGGVTNVIQDRIAAWPEDGREIYIARYGQPAAKLLAAASPNDRAALTRIAERYFVTDAGRDAMLRLIELHFDAGEFAACAALADRLLDHHPTISDTDRPLLLLRSSLAWSLAGEPARAKPRAELLATKYADARATLGGEDQSLSAVASSELARPRLSSSGTSQVRADAWPVPFGSNDHAAAPAEPDAPSRGQPAREWGKLLSFPLAETKPDPGASQLELTSLRALLKRQHDLGSVTGVLPAIDGSQLFFQDNTRLYARDLISGAALPGWLATYPKDAGAFKVEGLPTPRSAQMAVTLTDRYVLAIMGQSEPGMEQMTGGVQVPGAGPRLVCLDRGTGKVVWFKRMTDAADARAKQLAAVAKPPDAPVTVEKLPEIPPPAVKAPPGPRVRGNRRVAVPNAVPGGVRPGVADRGGDDSLRTTDPHGSVLVVGESVYIVARGGELGAFEDCYLVSFALADGEFRWARHLASGNSGRPAFNGYGAQPPTADSHLAAADGRIFVSTDMGAIAAVEAADGALAWLSLYPRPRGDQQPAWMNGNPNLPARVRPAFEGNPVIVRDGKVITMPSDAEDLFVHDANTGKELARVPTKWKVDRDYQLLSDPKASGEGVETEDYNVLAGITGDTVVITSPRSLALLDWSKLRAADGVGELATRDALKFHRVIRGPGFEEVAIRGRSFVTQRSVYVPTAWALMRFDLATHSVLEAYPANDSLENRPDESPGNLTVINGNLIVASADRISIYAGLDLVRKRLDAAIASAPDAVAPRLQYAQTLANAGHNDEALKWINDAVQRVVDAVPPRSADDAERAALFDATSDLARDLDRPGHKSDPAFQAKLLDQLAHVAATPTQQVVARLLRGGLAAKAKDFPAAVAAYQSLLEEPSWSSVHAKVGSEAVPIATIAGDALKALLTEAGGRDAYTAVEARAAAALERAKASNDAAAMFTVAEHFPNSHAAADAVRAASVALTHADAGGAGTDLAALRKLADRVGDPADRAAINEAMLHTYLTAGDLSAALGRARRIAWIDPSRSVAALPSVGATTFNASTSAALVEQLQQAVYARDEARLPDLNANFDGDSFDIANAVAVKDTMSLLAPADLTKSRADRVVTIARNRSLRIFEPGKTTPLQTVTVPGGVTDRTTPMWLANDQLLMRQPTRVYCVDVGRGTVAWSFDPTTLSADDSVSASDSAPLAGGPGGATIDDPELLALSPRPVTSPIVAAPLSAEEQQLQQLVQQNNMDPVIAERLLRNQRVARQNMALQQRGAAIVVNGGVINGNVVINGNGLINANDGGWDPDARADDGVKETVIAAEPAAHGAIIAVATSRGCVVGLDPQTGRIKWRVKPGDRAPATFVVVDDVIVFATTDETSSHLIALDANTGAQVLTRIFTGGPSGRLCNVIVSDEGFVAAVTGSGVQLFDVLGGEHEPLGNIFVTSESGAPPFFQSRAPDHAVFCGARLFVLADIGAPNTSARSFELPALAVTRVVDSKTKQSIERRFLPRFAKDQRTTNEQLSLAAHKDRLYVMTGLFMTSYPTASDDPADSTWTRALPDQPSALSLQSPMMVKDGVLLIGWPKDFIGMTSPAARAELYSRQTYDGKHESGMCVDDAELTRRGGKINDKFQPVTGGLCYTTTDGNLVFVPGKPKPAEAK